MARPGQFTLIGNLLNVQVPEKFCCLRSILDLGVFANMPSLATIQKCRKSDRSSVSNIAPQTTTSQPSSTLTGPHTVTFTTRFRQCQLVRAATGTGRQILVNS